MHRRQVKCIQSSMNAMEDFYTALLNEYRMALGVWSEARAIYSPDEPEVAAATKHLEALEEELATYSQPAALAA